MAETKETKTEQYEREIKERKELRSGELDLRALSEKMRQTKGYGG